MRDFEDKFGDMVSELNQFYNILKYTRRTQLDPSIKFTHDPTKEEEYFNSILHELFRGEEAAKARKKSRVVARRISKSADLKTRSKIKQDNMLKDADYSFHPDMIKNR